MYIRKILVKKRYGWRTVSLREFLRSHTIDERWQLIQDPSLTNCVNEFGEVINIEMSLLLLEELEAHLCTTMGDLKNFLLVYPDGKHEEFAREKIRSFRKAKPKPKRKPELVPKLKPVPIIDPVEIQTEIKEEAVSSVESS